MTGRGAMGSGHQTPFALVADRRRRAESGGRRKVCRLVKCVITQVVGDAEG